MSVYTKISLISLFAGVIVGMFAQKSRMCFIGGWRDFFLIRDKYLLKGFFSFVITAAVLFFIFDAAGYYLKNYPWFDRVIYVNLYDDGYLLDAILAERSLDYCELMNAPAMIVGVDTDIPGIHIGNFLIPNEVIMYLISAFIIGLFSTLANGCPMRQHVMGASGNLSAIFYLLGFYAAIIVFDKFLVQHLNELIN